MANRTLNFKVRNGNWWGPRYHERKLLIGPEPTLHWILPARCVGKYGPYYMVEKLWKPRAFWFVFLIAYFGRNLWCPWHYKRCERTNFGRQYITVLLLNKIAHWPLQKWQGPCNCYSKHCQRHNGPEGWVLLTKVTSPYTNLDQIPKFKISTKYQHFHQTLASKSWPNIHFITSPSLSSKILTRPIFSF